MGNNSSHAQGAEEERAAGAWLRAEGGPAGGVGTHGGRGTCGWAESGGGGHV